MRETACGGTEAAMTLPRRAGQDYKEAIRRLNCPQSNPAGVVAHKLLPVEVALFTVPGIIKHLALAGISIDDLDKLNVIHISGTKGKGSTCAFSECMLRKHGLRTGMFSSPHLVAVQERIAINGKPLSESAFTDYFWDVYNRLYSSNGCSKKKLSFFKYLTVMAFYVFLKEKVDVAIIEVGVGGQYDATNVIRNPTVCGVTSLGLDHTAILGSSLDLIAWQKAGIFKPGVPAITAPQNEIATKVLLERATKIGTPLLMSPPLDSHRWNGRSISLGVAGSIQRQNAALAVQLVATWLNRKKHPLAPLFYNAIGDATLPMAPIYYITPEILDGLRDCYWPGRHQLIRHGKISYFLDGAHTLESMQCCTDWFHKESRGDNFTSICRVLMFNVTGGRTPESLLSVILSCKFDVAIFCPNIIHISDCSDFGSDPQKLQNDCKRIRMKWEELSAGNTKHSAANFDCISSALKFLRSSLQNGDESDKLIIGSDKDPPLSTLIRLQEYSQIHVLVTGSLHLVGGVISILDPNLESRDGVLNHGRVENIL